MSEGPELNEVQKFYEERVLGFMISDLRKSVAAGTNFLTALGCLTYTEAIGTLLPELDQEPMGAAKEKRFYRCLFRLPSGEKLRELDDFIRQVTKPQQGLYRHLRHSATHLYLPQIKRRDENGNAQFVPVVVAKNSVSGSFGPGVPMNIDSQGRFVIGTHQYTEELATASQSFLDATYVRQEADWVAAGIKGYGLITKGLQ